MEAISNTFCLPTRPPCFPARIPGTINAVPDSSTHTRFALDMLNLLATTGLTFGVLVLVFRPLEMVFPAKSGQRFFRPGFLTDLCFFLGRHLFWGGIVFWLLLQLRSWVSSIVPPDITDAVARQPWWLHALEAVLLSDFFMYWGHRLQH